MKRLVLIPLVLSICMSGCFSTIQPSFYYKPLNTLQTEFYSIQTLYESGRFTETVETGEEFLKRYPRDLLATPVRYYVAMSYQELKIYDKSDELLNAILDSDPDTDWKKVATVSLNEVRELKKQQEK